MVFMVIAQRWTKFVQEDFLSGTACVAPVLGPCPMSLMFLLFLLLLVTMVQEFLLFFGTLILTLYSPPQLILTFYLLIRQVTTWMSVPSAAFPHFLLVAITETILFRGLFSSMWLGRLLAHSMRRWRLFLEPLPHCIPMWVLFYLPFLLEAFWGLPLLTCRYSLLGLGMPRIGSSSTTSLGHLNFRCMSSARASGPNEKWVGITNSLTPQLLLLLLLLFLS